MANSNETGIWHSTFKAAGLDGWLLRLLLLFRACVFVSYFTSVIQSFDSFASLRISVFFFISLYVLIYVTVNGVAAFSFSHSVLRTCASPWFKIRRNPFWSVLNELNGVYAQRSCGQSYVLRLILFSMYRHRQHNCFYTIHIFCIPLYLKKKKIARGIRTQMWWVRIQQVSERRNLPPENVSLSLLLHKNSCCVIPSMHRKCDQYIQLVGIHYSSIYVWWYDGGRRHDNARSRTVKRNANNLNVLSVKKYHMGLWVSMRHAKRLALVFYIFKKQN